MLNNLSNNLTYIYQSLTISTTTRDCSYNLSILKKKKPIVFLYPKSFNESDQSNCMDLYLNKKVQLAKTVEIKSFYDLHFMSNQTINHHYKRTLLLQDFRFLSHFSFSISHLHYNNQIFEEEDEKKNKKSFLLFNIHTSRYFVIYFYVWPYKKFRLFVYLHSSSSTISDRSATVTFL